MILLLIILIPVIASLLLPVVSKYKGVKEFITITASLVVFTLSLKVFTDGANEHFHASWLGEGLDFILTAGLYNSVLLMFGAFFVLAAAVYAVAFLKDKEFSVWFYFNLLLALGFVSGALLSGSLITILFFWESLVVVLYGFIALSSRTSQTKATAMKAFVIEGVAGLCLLLGIAILVGTQGTANLAILASLNIPLQGYAMAAFILMALGAVAKAGSFPFHMWLPDAAKDANLPFMAILPGALDKILGIYFLGLISISVFDISSSVPAQIFLLSLGAITLLLGDIMAALQNDYKKLVTYSTIGQAGYLIIGIGCANPIAFAGAIFHLINHSLYKVCLFFTAGNVEKQTGTTDITKLGGLYKVMPATAFCFVIASLCLLGIVPFNGFFSKELIYKGVMETSWPVIFIIAEIASVFAVFAFLKLAGVFFGKPKGNLKNVHEAPASMTVPAVVLVIICLVFGFGAYLPLEYLVKPMLASLGISVSQPLDGVHFDLTFVVSNLIVICSAAAFFMYAKKKRDLYKGAELITTLPVFASIYKRTERGELDLYNGAMSLTSMSSNGFYIIDRIIDFLIDTLPTWLANVFAGLISRAHRGSYMLYFGWMLIGILSFMAMIYYFEVTP